MEEDPRSLVRYSSGVSGLDTLLEGGLVGNQLYLVTGEPGTGKTILGQHFLRTGLDDGENVLYIHGEESKADLLLSASELGIDLSAADFLDIGPESEFFTHAQSYDIVDPQEIGDEDLIRDIREAIESRDPDRVLIDPINQLQYIEPSEYQYRKRIIAFVRFLKAQDTTVMATKTPSGEMGEQLRSLSDGVIRLQYTTEGRRIEVSKHRVVGQRDGTHGFEIRDTGIEVYPAIRPREHERVFQPTKLQSGVEGLDALLDGGLEQGTVTVISGPSGVGKSTTATEFLHTVTKNEMGALAYLFEESVETFTHRAEAFGIPVSALCSEGSLSLTEVDPGQFSPEEFARLVERQVEQTDAGLVVIDGIEGYSTSIKGGERDIDLQRRLHALTQSLSNMNVSVILIDVRHEVTGLPQPTGANVSYLADNLIFQQYVERDDGIKRIVGVLKKRISSYETEPRTFQITADGLDVQDPLSDIQGVLGGMGGRADKR